MLNFLKHELPEHQGRGDRQLYRERKTSIIGQGVNSVDFFMWQTTLIYEDFIQKFCLAGLDKECGKGGDGGIACSESSVNYIPRDHKLTDFTVTTKAGEESVEEWIAAINQRFESYRCQRKIKWN